MAAPTENRRARFASSTTDAASFDFSTATTTWALNTAVPSGQTTRWIAIVSSDGIPTLSTTSSGWTKLRQDSIDGGTTTTRATMGIFYTDTTASFAASAMPALVVNSSASEQFTANLYAFTANAGLSIAQLINATAVTGTAANSDPPAVTNNTGAAIDAIVIPIRTVDSTGVATVVPTGYASGLSQAAAGTGGASTNTCEKTVTALANGSSEDPGAYTSPADDWISNTLAVYQTSAATLSPPPLPNPQIMASLLGR